MIDGWGISCEIDLIWMSIDFTDDQSILVQVMAWCHQATSHYLSQCWPRSLSPYGVTRPQRVKKKWVTATSWSSLEAWRAVWKPSVPPVVIQHSILHCKEFFYQLLHYQYHPYYPKPSAFHTHFTSFRNTIREIGWSQRDGEVSNWYTDCSFYTIQKLSRHKIPSMHSGS